MINIHLEYFSKEFVVVITNYDISWINNTITEHSRTQNHNSKIFIRAIRICDGRALRFGHNN